MREPRSAKEVVCEHCGGEGFFEGVLHSWGQARFLPKGGPLGEGPEVEALVCTACGSVRLWADPDAIRSVLGMSS